MPGRPIQSRRTRLALLGLGASGLLLMAGLGRSSIPAVAAGPLASPCFDQAEPLLARAILDSERKPTRQRPQRHIEGSSLAPERIQDAANEPRTEREFLAGFLAQESARPGALEERAEALIGGNGSNAEKVAFLRALEQCGSPQHLVWLERSVSSLPAESGPHGVSVAQYALQRLMATARTNGAALGALRRLAFEARGLEPDLRRSAALGLAQGAGEAELGELRAALARETDPLLVAGVVAALRDRPASVQSARLLAEYDTLDRSPALTTDEE